MIPILLNFVPTILKYGRVILILVALWFVYDFVTDSYKKTIKIQELSSVIADKDAEIATLKLQAEISVLTTKIVDEANKVAEAVKDKYNGIVDAIQESGDTENGEIAPILRDTINTLDGM